MLNAATILSAAARLSERETRMVCAERPVSLAGVEAASAALAARLLSLGVGPGATVALFCPNSLHFVAAYFAVMRVGAVAAPLNILLKRAQIAACLADCSPAVLVCGGFPDPAAPQLQEAWEGWRMAGNTPVFARITEEDGLPGGLAAEAGSPSETVSPVSGAISAHPTRPDDVCCVIYTSGTTGNPKGVELTHGNLFSLAYAFSRHMRVGPSDTVLAGMPLFSSFGQTATLCASLLAGASLVILPRYNGDAALDLIHRHRVTFFGGVPTMIHGVVHGALPDGVDPRALAAHWRLSFAGGAHAPAALLEGFRERFGIPIVHGYGLTETSAVSSFNPVAGPHKDATIGVPLWGVEMRVVDETMAPLPTGERGELVIRGPHVMKGYRNNPEANAAVFRGGWLHTGDIATVDDDGYVQLAGRLKEMILRGGQNVYPNDVEEVLQAHSAVSLAAVVGVPDERLGEEVAACVVLKAGAESTPEALKTWCRERLPAFAYPRTVEIRESLPVGATGKILKREIVVRAGGAPGAAG